MPEDSKRISFHNMSFRTHSYCEWYDSVENNVYDVIVCGSLTE